MAETTLPTNSADRKATPLARGFFDYFPAAIAEVSRLSMEGARKHCHDELFHNRNTSTDHADCILRHLMERGNLDGDGFLHDVKVAWRALAQLQEALEARGAPVAPAARFPEEGEHLCENDIEQRIAGDSSTARRIKNAYYKVKTFEDGTRVFWSLEKTNRFARYGAVEANRRRYPGTIIHSYYDTDGIEAANVKFDKYEDAHTGLPVSNLHLLEEGT